MSKQTSQSHQTTTPTPARTPAPSKVVSIDEARGRLRSAPPRPRSQRLRPAAAIDPPAIEGQTATRLTPEAREAIHLRAAKYANRLIRCAGNFSEAETNKTDGAITMKHVRAAGRLGSLNPDAKPPQFGVGFMIDVALIVGAATVGALCTNPALLEGYGYVMLAAGMALAVGAFVVREALQSS
jgi:hypothetical protein